MEDEYLVLQCPACERDVKVSSNSAGVRMGCPYCREPLQIVEAEPEEPAKDDKPVIRLPLVFRHLKDDDVSLDHDLEFADEFERRRLPFEPPEWDDAMIEEKRRDAVSASELQEEDTSAAGGARGKRQARRKLLTRNEQVFRSITLLIMTSALVFAAVIVYSALVRGVAVVHQDGENMKELPGEVRRKIAEVVGQKKPILDFLTSAEEAAAVAIVNGFLEAKTVEDRLPFVRQPQRVEPLMRAWYAEGGSAIEWPDGTVLLRDKRLDQGRYFIRLAIEFVGIGSHIFVVEQTAKDFKLDWETATGYQPKPFAEYQAERPTTPVEFRVKLKPSDYYNYEFDDRDRYYSIELSYPGRPEFKLFGYIDRSRDWAPALIEKMDGGDAPSMIVQLQYPSGELEGGNQVEIISISSESWFL